MNAPRARAELRIPDVRDGLTALERAILLELAALARELGPHGVSTAMLYGRVSERLSGGVDAHTFQGALRRLVGR